MLKGIRKLCSHAIWFLTAIPLVIIWISLALLSLLLKKAGRFIETFADRMEDWLDNRSYRYWSQKDQAR